MSTVNLTNLLIELNKKISQTINEKELLILLKAVQKLKLGVVFTVGSFANLPSASDNIGKLYFVENDSILYYGFISDYDSIAQWVPITQVSVNTLWTWGCNQFGPLGDGTTVKRCSPGTVIGDNSKWTMEFSVYCLSGAAIKTDGTLWTWGNNGGGELGDGTTVSRCSPGTVAGGGTNWCNVSTTEFSMQAIKTDGTLWTWGNNCRGRLGDGTTVNRSSPGTVAGGGTTWCKVSSATKTVGAIKTDGTLWTWGSNIYGLLAISCGDSVGTCRCSPGTTIGNFNDWCEITFGVEHAASIKTDGTLWTWGDGSCGRLGDGTGNNRSSPGTVVGGGTWIAACAANYAFSVGIKSDGTLWTWGRDDSGSLGAGTNYTNRCSPGTIAGGGTTWCQVSGGSFFGSAVKTDGTLWTWGSNYHGKLGDGTETERCSPGTVAGGGTTWRKAISAYRNMFALTQETL